MLNEDLRCDRSGGKIGMGKVERRRRNILVTKPSKELVEQMNVVG